MNDDLVEPSRSIAELLQQAVVSFCVDTNLLVEFTSFDAIPWRDLALNAEHIRIIVPTKVGEEMDEHKNKSGKLRRRAIEFSQLARQMEDSPDGVATLKANNPRITIEFGPLFRKAVLDADQFDLDDNDNRIVAEISAIARSVEGAILLADDSKPIRLARQAGLPHVRPLPSWRRAEGPDERDTEIRELRQELGAQPRLVVSCPEAGADNALIIEAAPQSTDLNA